MVEFVDGPKGLGPLERESLEWILRLTSGQATVSDAEALAAWKARSPAHEAAFQDVLRLRHVLRLAGREYMAGNVTNGAVVRASHGVNRRVWLAGTAAACAVGGVAVARPPFGLWPSFAELTADYRTGTGEQRTVQPMQGVSLLLNTQTALSISATQGGATIQLISGEANFHSMLGHARLTVIAGRSIVAASQADFSVRHEDDGGGCVICLGGDVHVRRAGIDEELTAGQQLAYGAGEPGVVSAINTTQATAWQKGLLYFHDMPFSQMVHEINRYRSGKVILADSTLAKKRFNGVFHIGRIDGVVPAIEKLGVRVRELPGGIVLLG